MILLLFRRVLTPVVLLFLVVIPQFSFSLRSHSALRLHHLLGLTLTRLLLLLLLLWLKALRSVEALKASGGTRSRAVVLMSGMMTRAVV